MKRNKKSQKLSNKTIPMLLLKKSQNSSNHQMKTFWKSKAMFGAYFDVQATNGQQKGENNFTSLIRHVFFVLHEFHQIPRFEK